MVKGKFVKHQKVSKYYENDCRFLSPTFYGFKSKEKYSIHLLGEKAFKVSKFSFLLSDFKCDQNCFGYCFSLCYQFPIFVPRFYSTIITIIQIFLQYDYNFFVVLTNNAEIFLKEVC